MSDRLLDVSNISKSYAGVKALDKVSLSISKGEIHCLVGENGSGKSTLIKIIGGVVRPDSGEIVIKQKPHRNLHAIDAIREGVQIIYQDLSLYPNLSVAENISLNQIVERGRTFINMSDVKKIAEKALAEIGVELELNERVENLSMSKRQLVAISRALTQEASLIIMDEPTSALTRGEIDLLFLVITRLQRKGISILFVSHKLGEVLQIAEIISILRDGKKVGDYRADELDNEKLVYLMTGKKVENTMYSYNQEKYDKENILEVRNLTRKGQFYDISFHVRQGEILGITGLLGSGRTEIALALFGLNKIDSGQIFIENREFRPTSPSQAVRLGISYLPEDRLMQGLFISQSIARNIIVTVLKRILNAFRLISAENRNRIVREQIEGLMIKTANTEEPAQSLSGGNQQRVVLAKWLATNPKIFILDGPTIGVDIASKSHIHAIIRGLAGRGIGIIIISDEISEVLQNCNRILVMSQGRIVGDYPDPSGLTENELYTVVNENMVSKEA
jgi:simple sugar transport system ATP-binding protein